MRNHTVHTWVQNVYNQWVLSGTTQGYLSPILNTFFKNTQTVVHKQAIIRPVLPTIHTSLYTRIKAFFNLLYTQLYPQSTAPIIKKKKKI